jgi:membrane-bound serine protease (ClpP class)
MSPGTNIGAATPVTIEGAEVGDKIVNNATSYIAAIAEERGRNVEVAREMVQEGRSEPSSRAVRLGVADLVAADREMLLRAIDGREVSLDERDTVRLRTRDAAIVEHEMGWLRNVRQRLADPNLAFLFLSLGTLAIVYELANPGIGFGGIVGVILVVLGFFALAVLPVNVAGVALLLLAAGLFVAELFVPGIGVLAAGGAVSLALAGVFLVRGSPRVDLVVILPTVTAITAGVVLAGRLAWRARRAQPTWGAESLQGRRTTVRRTDGSTGQVLLEGAWWTVRSDEPLEVGLEVLVKHVNGLELVVERAERGQG